MNVTHLSFLVVMLVQCVITRAEFSPVEWNVSSSEQCGEHNNPDLTGVLTTVTQVMLNNKTHPSLLNSCMEIKESSTVSPCGTNGSAGVVYCNMDDLFSCPALEQTLSRIKKDVDSLLTHPLLSSCLEVKESTFENSTYCNITGPWVKLASWDVSQSGSSCPSGLQLFVNGTVSACGVQEGSSAGCQSLPLFSSPVPYTQVCGRMIGYQKGSPDAFVSSNINGVYVNGVSITQGSPRQHIWTYVIGVQENIPRSNSLCPCNTDFSGSSPGFVGSDYFCESGCPAYHDGTTFHAADPLWDGQGCGALEAVCCAAPGQPWFHKVFDALTIDYFEMRLCIDEPTSNENVLISSYEIYVL